MVTKIDSPGGDRKKIPIRVMNIFSEEDYGNMRKLARVYGFRYAQDVLAQAVKDAIEHVNCPREASNQEEGTPSWAAKMQADLTALKSRLSVSNG